MLCCDTVVTSSAKEMSDASKENTIDELTNCGLQKQSSGTTRVDLSRLPIKTSFQRMALEDNNDWKETMNKNEIDALRKSVLQCNRPLNPWYEQKSYANSSPNVESTANTKAENISLKELRPNSSTNINHITHVEPNKSRNVKARSEAKLHKYASNNGASLKIQLLDQQQQKTLRNTDPDMSKAIISEIKLLEQLEIENLKRVNDMTMLQLELSSKSGDSDTQEFNSPTGYRNGRTINYNCKRDIRVNEKMNNSKMKQKKVAYIRDKSTRRNNMFNDDQFYERDKIKYRNYYADQRSGYKIASELSSPLKQPSISSDDSFNLQRRFSPHILDGRRKLPRISLPTCYSCGEGINDVVSETPRDCNTCSCRFQILQALGVSYHARCFKCVKCNQCLDGIPFAVDTIGKVFCMDDYETMFIPACVACHKPISAINELGQIIRIVFQNQEYHIECFNCEGCGLQLSNEQPNRCYPLSSHLLCRNCHVQWKMLDCADAPITDL